MEDKSFTEIVGRQELKQCRQTLPVSGDILHLIKQAKSAISFSKSNIKNQNFKKWT